MKCPYCGKEMTPGYIQCRDGVYWGEKKRLVAALPLSSGKLIYLSTNGNAAEASLCLACQKIVIDCGKEKKPAQGGGNE